MPIKSDNRKSIWESRPISVNRLFVEKQLPILEIVTTKRLHFATKSANLAAVKVSMLVISRWRRDCCAFFCRSRHFEIVTSRKFNLLTLVLCNIWQSGIVLNQDKNGSYIWTAIWIAVRILLISWKACFLSWERSEYLYFGNICRRRVDVVKGGRCKANLLLIGRTKITQLFSTCFPAHLNCLVIWVTASVLRHQIMIGLEPASKNLVWLLSMCLPKSIWPSVYLVKTIRLGLFILWRGPCNWLNERTETLWTLDAGQKMHRYWGKQWTGQR